MVDIDYNDFKKDCAEIIQPFLQQYKFEYTPGRSEDYINIYQSPFWVIEISLLENYPYVGISYGIYNLDGVRVKTKLLDMKFNESKNETIEFYKLFNANNNLSLFSIQMKFSIESLKKFYLPILNGEFKFSDYQKLLSEA